MKEIIDLFHSLDQLLRCFSVANTKAITNLREGPSFCTEKRPEGTNVSSQVQETVCLLGLIGAGLECLDTLKGIPKFLKSVTTIVLAREDYAFPSETKQAVSLCITSSELRVDQYFP